jgi:hypothetical protein
MGYMTVGLAIALPCVLVPPFLEAKADKDRPISQKYWVKANVWIAIFSFIGNYFWTHYFYKLLGATYTFKAHRLNDVGRAVGKMHVWVGMVHCELAWCMGRWVIPGGMDCTLHLRHPLICELPMHTPATLPPPRSHLPSTS